MSALSSRRARRAPGGHRRCRPAVAPEAAQASAPPLTDPADSLDFADGKTITEAIQALEPDYETGPPWTGASEPGQPEPAGADPDATSGFPVADLTRLLRPTAHGIIPTAPLTLPPAIFDDMGGCWTRARSCWYCHGPQGRMDLSWRPDALGRWSCPLCQMRPDWRAPCLPELRGDAPEPAGVNGGAEL